MFPSLTELELELKYRFPELKLFLLESCSSTNSFLKEQLSASSLCYCKKQLGGYGQRSAKWQSDSQDLTFSLLLPFKAPLHRLDGLPQLIAFAIAEQLNRYYDLDVCIKWPNDIVRNVSLNQGTVVAKLGGILVEVKEYKPDSCWLIIGIGLNGQPVNQHEYIDNNKDDTKPALVKSGCGFRDADNVSNQAFFTDLLEQLITISKGFQASMFTDLMDQFKKLDYFTAGQQVFVYDTDTKKKGVYKGVNASGELLVSIDGLLTRYRSGSVSIRPCEAYE